MTLSFKDKVAVVSTVTALGGAAGVVDQLTTAAEFGGQAARAAQAIADNCYLSTHDQPLCPRDAQALVNSQLERNYSARVSAEKAQNNAGFAACLVLGGTSLANAFAIRRRRKEGDDKGRA